MATKLTQAIIDSDPTIKAIAQSSGGNGRAAMGSQIQSRQQMRAYLESKGYELPEGFGISQGGSLQELPKGMNWWALAAPAAVLGGVGIAGALGAGAGAAGAGQAAAGGLLPSTTIGTGAATLPAVAASGAVPAATAGTLLPATALGTGAALMPGAAAGSGVGGALAGAAASGGSLWSKIGKLAAPLIGAGASVAQGAISANAAKKAAEQQQAATMAALGLQREIWEKNQANLAPYMSLGPGAISNLQGLTGTRPASQVFGGK